MNRTTEPGARLEGTVAGDKRNPLCFDEPDSDAITGLHVMEQ